MVPFDRKSAPIDPVTRDVREKLAAACPIPLALAVLELEKALTGLTVIPIAIEGTDVVTRGGDSSPYTIAMLAIVTTSALSMTLIRVMAR